MELFRGNFQWRFLVGVMIFTIICINHMLKVNLSVNLVAMVPVTNHTLSASQVTLNWTAYERAQVLSAIYWGQLFGTIICGPVIEMFGPRILVSVAILTCSVLTHLSPAAAKLSYVALLVIRIIMGIVSGMVFPAMHVLISKWAVRTEKGRFLGALIGGTIGTFFAWAICGLIIEPFGWEWGFHIFGILGFVGSAIYWFVVYDTPEKHPRISLRELQYIREGCADKPHKLIAPYKKMLKSVPFWSLFIVNFGNGWGIYFIITAVPNYFAAVLGYRTSSTGLLSALIYLLRCLCAMAFGYVGDIILKKNLLSLNVLRKVACFLSHVIPGCIILCMAIPNYDPIFYVALIILAKGMNGFVTVSSAANTHDLTKNFVGALAGMIGFITTLAGVITPFVTAYFTKNDETSQEQWQPVFYVGGLVYILSGLQFIIFGSTEYQPWDFV